ncbi:MAG: HAD-IA family hydrolase [Nanoarchaeota archaeon]|nr:HAD-IA family hydrolase [Nanoarchaeota archaeon]
MKAVLFDLDNTLIDFWKMKELSCGAAMDAMIDSGLNINRKKALVLLFKLYDQYGYEDKEIFQKFLKKVTGKIDYRLVACGIVAYRSVRGGFLHPYPDTEKVLMALKQKKIKLGIVTDAPRLKAWIRLEAMQLSNFFDVVVTHEDTHRLKPSTMPFRAALKKLEVEPEDCLMLGDMPNRDMVGARKIGMKTCFARYGNSKAKKVKADFEITDLKMLLKIV